MKFLIHMVTNWIVRLIERGSLTGAALGALLAGSGAMAVALFLVKTERVQYQFQEVVVPYAVAGAIAGAMTGSRLGRAFSRRIERNGSISGPRTIRVSRLNHSLAPLGVAGILLAVGALIILTRPEAWQASIVLLFLSIGALAVAAMRDLWVEIGLDLTVHRLFSTKTYSRRQLHKWGFEIARGKLTQQPPDTTVPLVLGFAGGLWFEAVVSPQEAKAVAAALSQQA